MSIKILSLIAITILVSSISGCTTHFQGSRPGGTQAQFSGDLLDCQDYARPRVDEWGFNWSNLINSCMQAKGWIMDSR